MHHARRLHGDPGGADGGDSDKSEPAGRRAGHTGIAGTKDSRQLALKAGIKSSHGAAGASPGRAGSKWDDEDGCNSRAERGEAEDSASASQSSGGGGGGNDFGGGGGGAFGGAGAQSGNDASSQQSGSEGPDGGSSVVSGNGDELVADFRCVFLLQLATAWCCMPISSTSCDAL